MVRYGLATAVWCTLALLDTAGADAQAPPAAGESRGIGGVIGVVRDSAGAGIAGAQVTIAGMVGRGITGADGTFRLIGVTAGNQILVVRRIGFQPDSQRVTIPRSANVQVSVRLAPAPGALATVVVDGPRPAPVGRLRGFYERRQRGIGHFFTIDDIERRRPHLVSDLLRTLPGVNVARRTGETVVTFRGSRCTPLVWVDGSPAATGWFDPDVLVPTTLAGVEVYPGAASVPPELSMPTASGGCGVIALWSREPPPRRGRKSAPADSSGPSAASLPAYTADQVETPAAVDTMNPVAPLYPDSLLRASVAGRVLVEFVVDTAGVPEMPTFFVVISTHALFSESVRRAVSSARFTPAVRDGKAVRQRVQLPLAFAVPRTE